MGLNNKDDEIFNNKSLSDLLKDIYENSTTKKQTIDTIMRSFLSQIKEPKDISYVGSIVKELLDVSVRNDEQIVKVATIAQRLITTSNNTDEGMFTELEKEELLQSMNEMLDTKSEIDNTTNNIKSEIEPIDEQSPSKHD